MFHQRRNVFTRARNGGQRDRKHIQTVVEVAAKFVPLHHVHQISVGRGHEPNVHLVSPECCPSVRTPVPVGHAAVWAAVRRNIAHFVQEERAFVGQLETANLLRYGSGERAAFVAKKLAFQ